MYPFNGLINWKKIDAIIQLVKNKNKNNVPFPNG
jgi:hypothetical protein